MHTHVQIQNGGGGGDDVITLHLHTTNVYTCHSNVGIVLSYGVATMSRLLKMTGFFRRISSVL